MTAGASSDYPNPGESFKQDFPTSTLIRSLCDPSVYDHTASGIRVVETHISWIILTGPFAYKVKKPVSLGFLDFGTLSKRKAMCMEELRLNRRLAPELYLDVVAITGSETAPVLNGSGAAIEYAVKMVQFDIDNEMAALVCKGLPISLINDLASGLADFHLNRARICSDQAFSTPAQVGQRIKDNFVVLRQNSDSDRLRLLDYLETWVDARLEDLEESIERRGGDGFVRECHGDLHLGNMVVIGDRVRLFDCLEFDVRLRWIDVISEVAFVVMDFDYHGCSEYGYQFLNRYLSVTGDYSGLELLPLYLVYRAMVRAKVASIRNQQSSKRGGLVPEVGGHLELAGQYLNARHPRLFITHGYSGSGKSWWSERLARKLPAIHIRSDVERDRTVAGADAERYSPENIALNYEHLVNVAGTILDAEYSVIVDATFLRIEQRNMFYTLAENRGVETVVLDMQCDERLLRSRIAQRSAAGSDPSQATTLVLDMQMRHAQPLSELDKARIVTIEAGKKLDPDAILGQISAVS